MITFGTNFQTVTHSDKRMSNFKQSKKNWINFHFFSWCDKFFNQTHRNQSEWNSCRKLLFVLNCVSVPSSFDLFPLLLFFLSGWRCLFPLRLALIWTFNERWQKQNTGKKLSSSKTMQFWENGSARKCDFPPFPWQKLSAVGHKF